MLSSLPPELLRDIIEATVPHTFHSWTYNDRRATLCSLSLVCKLFHSIAQPLLLEIVYGKSLRQFESLPPDIDEGGGGVKRTQRIKSTVVTLQDDVGFLPGNAGAGLRTIKNVENLTLDGHYQRRVDLSLILSLQSMLNPIPAAASRTRAHDSLLQTDLSSLHLSGCKAASSEPVIFPSLRSLTLYFVDEDLSLALLNPDSLPGLEELAWYETSSALNPLIERSSFGRLLPQLKLLIFSIHAWRTLADTQVRSAASRTLVDCLPYELSDLSESALHPVHLRIHGLSHLDGHNRLTTFFEEIADLTSYIESNPSLPLRNVYLGCAATSLVRLSSTPRGYVDGLSRVCQERKIDLIFEIGPEDHFVDPCFSPDFSRRMKERRRKENVE